MIIYDKLSESSNIMQILEVLSSELATQSKGQAYFSVIFLWASDQSFIYSLIMNEFLICARPLITAINKYRLNLFEMVKRPMYFHSLWVQRMFTLGQENDCVQIYLCHLAAYYSHSGNFSKILMLSLLWEKAMAPHSSTLAWKIPWMEEPDTLQSMGSRRVGHDWATSLSLFTFIHRRRKWQPTLVFLPGEPQGWGSLVGCHLWGHTESDTTKVT